MLTVLIGGVLGGSAVSALITQIGEAMREKKRRQAAAEQGEDEDIAALKDALKWVLYDRIRFLGMAYVREGGIDFDDRRVLSEMHRCYHDGLGGNGDLDTLMRAVNSLPLK